MAISAKQVMELRKATGLGMMTCKKALNEADGDYEKAVEILRKEGLKTAAKKAGRTTGEGLVRVRLSDDMRTGTLISVLCETEPVVKTPMFREFVDRLADVAHASGVRSAEEALALPWDGEEATVEEAFQGLIARIGENMKIDRVVRIEAANDGVVGSYVHFNEKLGAMVAIEGTYEDMAGAAKELCMHIAYAKPSALTRDEVPAEEIEQETRILREQIAEDPKLSNKPEQALAGILQGRLNKNFFGARVLTEQGWFRDGGDTTVSKHLEEWGVALDAYALVQVGG